MKFNNCLTFLRAITFNYLLSLSTYLSSAKQDISSVDKASGKADFWTMRSGLVGSDSNIFSMKMLFNF